MFTGIVTKIGKVLAINPSAAGARLTVEIGELAREVKPGGSVAVNGACLSAVKIYETAAEFDAIFETLSRTNIGLLARDHQVNVELPLRVTDRIEGHFVQGHIDTTCRIVQWQDQGASRLLTLELDDPQYARYIVPKGSVAIDGISLTVARNSGNQFSVALIPTTLEQTTLIHKPIGAVINFEADILVKTIVNLLKPEGGSDESLLDKLRQTGFIS